ncbi:M20/M25/M40 family metallo-hydrolase [Conexibacter sp. SYSU D00693]|uniref:M20/M25/M40 family metallo-hydrolase n=1 Tax=Conexibacter sp. SYSU D00693 TaxID=2812560 RepID=UPI00196B5359|nr:M20/M25/M40 family metallo-hydrolase [Conexibacter sp. SYSU D00693]
MPDLQAAAVDLLQRLLRHRTVNPPGDERACLEMLAAELRDAGFDEVTLVGSSEQRQNLVGRLRGKADGPTLCLLSHVDTVLAEPSEWQRDPWGGDLVDGDVWGRGAQDMKSQTAAEVAAACDLARSDWRPAAGDLLVVAVCDEEVGGELGAIWLCDTHPDLVRCDFLLNEGGGSVIPHGDELLMGVCAAEKGVQRFTLTVRGVAGHASMPAFADNALPKLAPLLERLATAHPGYDLTEAPQALLGALELTVDDLPALRERAPQLAAFVEPMCSVTFAPTMAAASTKINVIPSAATLKVDCRTPPGLGADAAERRIREVLGDLEGWELSFDEQVVGNGSPVDTPLMDALRGWAGREVPEARMVPVMLPAYTDSRTFRDAFPECVAYGFFPQRTRTLFEMWPLVHGKDERIHVDDVGLAARCYRDVAKELLG